jgi:hypothetical protein
LKNDVFSTQILWDFKVPLNSLRHRQEHHSIIIYRRAATKARMAPSPLRATVFRLAAPGEPVADGGVVVTVTEPLREVVVPATVVVAMEDIMEDIMDDSDIMEDIIDDSVIMEDISEVIVAGIDEAPAEVETGPEGMLKVTPAAEQSPWAALTVSSNWAGVQAA